MSVVVVTGAGQSQGAAEDLPGVGYRQLDVTDQAGWTGLGKELAERYGRVHGLVASAGITWRARWSRSCSASRPRSISGAEIPVDGSMTAHGGVKSISDAMRA